MSRRESERGHIQYEGQWQGSGRRPLRGHDESQTSQSEGHGEVHSEVHSEAQEES